MSNENDPLIEHMRDEAMQMQPPFSIDLHERLVKRFEYERAASKRKSGYRFIPWIAIAAAAVIACTAFFAGSRFLHRDAPSIRRFAKLVPVIPRQSEPKTIPLGSPTIQTNSTLPSPGNHPAPLEPVVVRPAPEQRLAALPVAPQPVAPQPVVSKAIENQPIAIKPTPNQQVATQQPVKLPPVVKPNAQQPVTHWQTSPIALRSPTQLAATLQQPGPVSTVLRKLDRIAPVKLLTFPVKVFPAADRHVAAGLDSAIAGTFNTVFNQMGNVVDGLLQPFGSRR